MSKKTAICFFISEQPSTQVRPTQQVQPVSPVVDTPASETQSLAEQVTPVEPVPSTSRTTPPPASQPSMPAQSVVPSNKRQREDTERYNCRL